MRQNHMYEVSSKSELKCSWNDIFTFFFLGATSCRPKNEELLDLGGHFYSMILSTFHRPKFWAVRDVIQGL